VDAPDPLTGHSCRLHTLHDFVGTRGLTFVQNVPLPSTHPFNCLSSSVCNLMRRRPIHLIPPASGAQRSPLRYPANRTRSDGWPRRIRCYKMCSLDSGPWCWDATTQAARDDTPSQRRGWREVLSFFFEVRVRQGMVTLPCKSIRGVRAPNMHDTRRGVEIQGNLTFSAGKLAGHIEAGGASIAHKVPA